MRPFPPLLFVLAVWVIGVSAAQGNTPPWDAFVTVYDPALTVNVTRTASPNQYCNIDTFPPPKDYTWTVFPPGMKLSCMGGTNTFHYVTSGYDRYAAPEFPQAIGNDAVGNTYLMTGVLWAGGGPGLVVIYRDRHTGLHEPLIQVTLDTGPVDAEGEAQTLFSATFPSIDLVHGTITFAAEGETLNAFPGASVRESTIITINGLPQLYDEMLSFVPGGSALSLTTAVLPDAFRSADSVQVWTGNVRSMPDWSQAEPLTCTAAINPTPGQVLLVADSLQDPSLNEGRYYVAANVSGGERRLGRQYVTGSFSARDPSSLPACH